MTSPFDPWDQRFATGTEADADDEVTQNASSSDPASAPASEGVLDGAADWTEGEQEPEALVDDELAAPDLEELMVRASKADEYLALAQRTKADFENYRKRAIRDAAAAQERGVAKLALELLPAVDNLDRAVQAADGVASGEETLVSGIRLVHADVIAALARAGIEAYSPKGEPFDPERHEAVAQLPVEGAEPGTIVEVYQPGYRLRESVLRPARVVVAA
jgi:molecular chaperone GrpE